MNRGYGLSYLDHNAAGDGQISVEPGVPDAPSVALHPHLETPQPGLLRPGFDLNHQSMEEEGQRCGMLQTEV